MFGLGAREAVLSALHADDPRGFGSPCSAVELVVQLSALAEAAARVRHEDGAVVARLAGTDREQGAADAVLRAAAFALGWRAGSGIGRAAAAPVPPGDSVDFARPTTPHGAAPHTSRRPLEHGQIQQGPRPSRRRRAAATRPAARRAPPHDRRHLGRASWWAWSSSGSRRTRCIKQSRLNAAPAGLHRRLREGRRVPAGRQEEGDRQPGAQARGHPDHLRRRAAGVRSALPGHRAVRAQVLHRQGPAARSSTSCTTSSTATACSGTTTRSPRTPSSSTRSRRSRTKYEGTKLTDKFIALPWTSKDGKAFPSGTHVALTHWSAGGDPSDVSKQQGIWQYCATPSGAVTEQFTKDYPYSDSPEPQAT